jgi:hypothetical protein
MRIQKEEIQFDFFVDDVVVVFLIVVIIIFPVHKVDIDCDTDALTNIFNEFYIKRNKGLTSTGTKNNLFLEGRPTLAESTGSGFGQTAPNEHNGFIGPLGPGLSIPTTSGYPNPVGSADISHPAEVCPNILGEVSPAEVIPYSYYMLIR